MFAEFEKEANFVVVGLKVCNLVVKCALHIARAHELIAYELGNVFILTL